MKEEGKHYVDASKVSVAPIAKSIAKDMIIKNSFYLGLRRTIVVFPSRLIV